MEAKLIVDGFEIKTHTSVDKRIVESLFGGPCQQAKSSNNKGEDMSLVSKIKNLAKSADTKLLEKYGITDDNGILTSEGEEVVVQHLFEKHKAEIVEEIKKIDKEDK